MHASEVHVDNDPAVGFRIVDLTTEDYVPSPMLRGFTIGGAGNLKVTMADGSTGVIPSACLIVGVQYAAAITKIYKDGTTATSIIGWV